MYLYVSFSMSLMGISVAATPSRSAIRVCKQICMILRLKITSIRLVKHHICQRLEMFHKKFVVILQSSLVLLITYCRYKFILGNHVDNKCQQFLFVIVFNATPDDGSNDESCWVIHLDKFYNIKPLLMT